MIESELFGSNTSAGFDVVKSVVTLGDISMLMDM